MSVPDFFGSRVIKNLAAFKANADLLKSLTGYTPKTDVPEGMAKFVDGYKDYGGV